ncbi:MAG: ADP-glyceromanno-heptose 6-epimerase [Elusimicrobia bacterium]|nr:ADP-glyceromanno-heptose 6-epimerase [Candidatus Liberimonas magnetica]
MKIILTGGAGFIGSCLLWKLNKEAHEDILLVDELDKSPKWKNLVGKKYTDYIDKDELLKLIEKNKLKEYKLIIHMGACSSTTGDDAAYYLKNNYEYTRKLAEFSIKNKTRFIYASSGATYGDGSLGFSDDDKITPTLQPMNIYGYSKQLFDLWVLKNGLQKKFVGFKFFNVYGPNEYHKKEMMSLICKRFDDVLRDKKIGLFKSYRKDYEDGGQKRDFIYVKDVCDAVYYFVENKNKAGIFNVGTGKAHTWNELADALFSALNIHLKIDYIEMPEVLKDKYQYITEAEISKLRKTGYKKEFTPLKEAIKDYTTYLKDKSHL